MRQTRDWDILSTWASHDAEGALDQLAHLWKTDYGSVTHGLAAAEEAILDADKGARYLRLSTGGWSENEALIAALQANRLVWLLTWQLSARGGLYIFKYPSA